MLLHMAFVIFYGNVFSMLVPRISKVCSSTVFFVFLYYMECCKCVIIALGFLVLESDIPTMNLRPRSSTRTNNSSSHRKTELPLAARPSHRYITPSPQKEFEISRNISLALHASQFENVIEREQEVSLLEKSIPIIISILDGPFLNITTINSLLFKAGI